MIRSPTARALDALRRIVRALDDSAYRLERTAALTPAQRFVLEQLADGPLPTLNALAERTRTTQPTVSVVVGRLVRRGLVARRPDENDRRRMVLALTPAGRRLLARTDASLQSQLALALEAMPARRAATLAANLEEWVNAAGLGRVAPQLLREPARSGRRRQVPGLRPPRS
ncbi:MAG TPA: MarR family winged helix-turn-helix transcriptional regulator [Gemmatimonadales bacterium]|jgi:DNA-binding MarR family transcriptional regulator|nr:MarR family winged helix-turn-helix transcriptional regulator [Gemmatimonadales bacterium]